MYRLLKNSCLGFTMVIFLAMVSSCDADDDAIEVVEEELIIPKDLNVTIEVVGANSENPNGDGNGVIKCKASAANAVKYGFEFDTANEVESISGDMEFTATEKGTNDFSITVYAYSKTGEVINISKEVKIYVTPDLFSTLIFSDEFDVAGNPDNTKWGFDIGTGCPDLCGWGNAEEQYYTSRTDNVSVKDGFLTITAKKENYKGASYTSTKMLTKGNFDFTYGRVEVKAKLPEGKGTWPAIWMLGDNIDTVGWPACGEIDIMEHFGKLQGTISSAMHTPSSFGNTANHGNQFLADVSTKFHTYIVEWTAEEIVFKVDDVEHYRYNPPVKDNNTWPYNADQYLILNIAMGGIAGGSIDTNFSESNMEIDYIRVYQ
jgi:beta-glucanase (GH16 family)